MSVFDLFRGFFGVPGGHYRGEGRRDPFFDGMTHDDDDDDDDEDDDEEAFYHDGFRGSQHDHFDDALRFGFSFGPNGMRIDEPQVFGEVFRQMEEIFSQLGRLDRQPGDGHFGVPSIQPPPHQDMPERRGGSTGNLLRDFMLKSPNDAPQGPPSEPPREPRNDDNLPSGAPHYPSTPFKHWTPFSKFHDIWSGAPQGAQDVEKKEDRDLDSQVSSGGLDLILTPPPTHTPSQPKTRSFFQSVTVTKVVKPDGSVEERRTVRDGQGNEETTVTRTGAPCGLEEHQDQSRAHLPGDHNPFSSMQDEFSMFSKIFGGFKG